MISFTRGIRDRWRRDIQFRLWGAVLISVTLAGVASTVLTIESLRIDAEAEQQSHVENLADVLSKSLARPLFDLNSLAVTSVGEAVGIDPEVVVLRVMAPDGTVLVEAGAGQLSDSRSISVKRDVTFTTPQKIYWVGKIDLVLSGDAIGRKLRWQTLQAAISGLFLIVAIAISLYLVGRKITVPFADIQQALDRLALGDTDVKLSGVGREDQIGRLSASVDQFRSTLNDLRAAEKHSALLLTEKTNIADRLNAIYDGSNDAVMLLTDKGFFDCNQRTLEIFGVPTREAFVACHPSDLSPPTQADGRDSLSAANEQIGKAFQTGESRFEWLHMRRNGEVFPAEVLLSAFSYDGKRVLQATVRDITQRKRIELELQELNRDLESRIALRTREMSATLDMLAESKQKLQGIVDTALDAVVRVDSSGSIVGWNTQANAIFGWSSEEVLGKMLHETIIPMQYREAHLRGMERFIAGHPSTVIDRRIEITALNREGLEFPIELAITRVTLDDPAKYEFCAFIRDISRRKQAEEEIRVSLDKQRELNQLKSRFVSMASHEFRTPLATIRSSADLLEHYFDRLPENERSELFRSIANAVTRMTKMLEDILVIGKSDAERTEVNPARISLDVYCKHLVDALAAEQELAGNVRHSIKLSIDGGDMTGIFDEKLLNHILGNLLSNALKYSPAGGDVEFSLACAPAMTIFTVTDHGIGIPEEDMPGLFESFHRATNVGNIAGTGLGLAIVKRSVDAHAGTISVISKVGQGTSFTVSLPHLAAAQ